MTCFHDYIVGREEVAMTRLQATRLFTDWMLNRMAYSNDVIMSTMATQITSLTIVYSTVYSGEDKKKHQSSTSLAFVRGIHRWPVNSPRKAPVTRKKFPFDDVIMQYFQMNFHNTLRPRQNGRHCVDNIFKRVSWMKMNKCKEFA